MLAEHSPWKIPAARLCANTKIAFPEPAFPYKAHKMKVNRAWRKTEGAALALQLERKTLGESRSPWPAAVELGHVARQTPGANAVRAGRRHCARHAFRASRGYGRRNLHQGRQLQPTRSARRRPFTTRETQLSGRRQWRRHTCDPGPWLLRSAAERGSA